MTLQFMIIGLMFSNFHFFLGLSLSGIKQILKFKILHIQFSKIICSKKLDQNLLLYTILTIDLGLNYLLG